MYALLHFVLYPTRNVNVLSKSIVKSVSCCKCKKKKKLSLFVCILQNNEWYWDFPFSPCTPQSSQNFKLEGSWWTSMKSFKSLATLVLQFLKCSCVTSIKYSWFNTYSLAYVFYHWIVMAQMNQCFIDVQWASLTTEMWVFPKDSQLRFGLYRLSTLIKMINRKVLLWRGAQYCSRDEHKVFSLTSLLMICKVK